MCLCPVKITFEVKLQVKLAAMMLSGSRLAPRAVLGAEATLKVCAWIGVEGKHCILGSDQTKIALLKTSSFM